MSEFKNNALGEALKSRIKKIIILPPGPREGHPDEARDQKLLNGSDEEKGSLRPKETK